MKHKCAQYDFLFLLFIYFWLCQSLVEACGSFHCGMQAQNMRVV